MKKFITKVTVTGADDSVNPANLMQIAKEFPFVEFGLLLSRNSAGTPRFPSTDWLKRLVGVFSQRPLDMNINVSGHICGPWVKEIFLGAWPEDLPGTVQFLVDRWQLNTHGIPHECDIEAMMQVILRRNQRYNQEIIFQYDKANPAPLKAALESGLNVSALYDLSHGAGILPQQWERPESEGGKLLCGYAGGLSPENVAQQIDKIAQVAGDDLVWIDAETHLRSLQDGRDVFDLEKVRRFLQAVQPWVVGQ